MFRFGHTIAGAVPLDDTSGALAIPRDMGVHHIWRPWISSVNDLVPGLGFASAQAHGVAALEVINAAAEARDQHDAEHACETASSA